MCTLWRKSVYFYWLKSVHFSLPFTHATLFAPAANGNPDVILKYTYNGYPMQTYQFNYTNCSTGWKDVKKGAGTKDKVKLIKDVAITIGSALSTKLSYFSTGKSILDSFLAYYNLRQPLKTKIF